MYQVVFVLFFSQIIVVSNKLLVFLWVFNLVAIMN